MYLSVKLPFGIEIHFETASQCCCDPGCDYDPDALDEDVEDGFIHAENRYQCLRCDEIIHAGEPLDHGTAQLLMSVHICLGDLDPS